MWCAPCASAAIGSGWRSAGRTWPSTLNAGTVGITQLGFTTKTQGLLITNESGTGQMLMTHDGGRTWARVAF